LSSRFGSDKSSVCGGNIFLFNVLLLFNSFCFGGDLEGVGLVEIFGLGAERRDLSWMDCKVASNSGGVARRRIAYCERPTIAIKKEHQPPKNKNILRLFGVQYFLLDLELSSSIISFKGKSLF